MEIKILVVDDEPEVTNALVRYLRLEGFDTTGTTNPLEALAMVERGNYMLVISDIEMPEMRGTELLKKIKKYNGMIQVIIVTGYVTIDNILTCLRRGASDCFFKPLDDKVGFLGAVKTAVERLERWERVVCDLVKFKSA